MRNWVLRGNRRDAGGVVAQGRANSMDHYAARILVMPWLINCVFDHRELCCGQPRGSLCKNKYDHLRGFFLVKTCFAIIACNDGSM